MRISDWSSDVCSSDLLEEQLLDRIAAIPGPLDGASAYEVGPGPGGLTRALLRAGANVIAVERDRRCLPALAELQEAFPGKLRIIRSEEHTSELQSLMRISYAVFCLKKKQLTEYKY